MKHFTKALWSLFALLLIVFVATRFLRVKQSHTSKTAALESIQISNEKPRLLTDRQSDYFSVLITPDGKEILTGNNTKTTTVGNKTIISGFGVQVWDAKSLNLLSTLGVQNGVSPLAITPDGKKVVFGWDGIYNEKSSIAKSHALVYELATGKKILQMPEGTGTMAIAIAPHGKILALGLRKYLELRDLKTGHLLRRMKRWLEDPASSWVMSPTFSPDGKRIAFVDTLAESAYAYANGKHDEIGIFSIQDAHRLRVLGWNHTSIQDISFSPDGKYLAVIASVCRWPRKGQGNSLLTVNRILLCDAHTGHILRTLQTRPWTDVLDFSPNGKWLAVGSRGEGIQVWNMKTGKLHIGSQDYKPRYPDKFVYTITFTPDSETLVVGANKVTRISMQK